MDEEMKKGLLAAILIVIPSCSMMPPKVATPLEPIPSINCPSCFGRNNLADFWLLRGMEVPNGAEE